MPTFVAIGKHPAESCPMYNNEIKEKFKEKVSKREELAKKHEVKVISACTSVLDHLIYYVVAAPSQLALENYFMETGMASWNSIEIKQVRYLEDVLKML
jgi:hypothetical protein